MKYSRWSLWQSIAGCCLIAFLCSQAWAQDQPHSGTVNVPFDFYISGSKLPAGEYTLDIVAPTYVNLRSTDGKTQQALYFFQTAEPGKDPVSQVIFALRDGKYYFSEVWSWFGKAQLTSFVPKASDKTKQVPLKAEAEKDVAKPAGNL